MMRRRSPQRRQQPAGPLGPQSFWPKRLPPRSLLPLLSSGKSRFAIGQFTVSVAPLVVEVVASNSRSSSSSTYTCIVGLCLLEHQEQELLSEGGYLRMSSSTFSSSS